MCPNSIGFGRKVVPTGTVGRSTYYLSTWTLKVGSVPTGKLPMHNASQVAPYSTYEVVSRERLGKPTSAQI